ncbi:M50 family metallopeptidase [Luteipulveratus flavus]|uniref:Site-2 protease family protein n=1 Tax=Luteipulveratus flavus TaxID=3031728 RepID=A0ABT6C5C5_9MICO|nr:site-2 protease family protein [Luteipulveratus sp. YIM 133296]MDF8263259.1 site-2 protease family protein [Luteipulveratus sp. YIM 133296]
MFLLGVVLVLIGVALSIALHEIGHLVPAKKSGVKVTQYMVGFGPTVWSRRRGETEYGVKAIPLGGYIRMIGMLPPRREDAPGTLRATSTGRMSQMADAARADSFDQIEPGDENRVFYKLPVHRKVIIMLGGPFMNLVIAAVLLVVIACGVGLPKQTSASIAQVNECLPVSVADSQKATCSDADRSPAWKAGLKPGDVVVSVAGVPVTTTLQTTQQIRRNADRAIPVVVKRGGQQQTITVTPARRTMPKVDKDGQEVLTMGGQTVTEDVGVIGTSIGATYRTERAPLTEAPGIIGDGLVKTSSVFLRIPQKMVGVFNAAFGDGKRDTNGPISVVGVGRVAGEAANTRDIGFGDKIVFLLGLVASLNLALFVFNLIPLLPLDGGHVAGALWEGVKRGFARVRGVEGPVYADVTKALPVAYTVSMVLIVMSVLLIYADIVNPIKLGN